MNRHWRVAFLMERGRVKRSSENFVMDVATKNPSSSCARARASDEAGVKAGRQATRRAWP